MIYISKLTLLIDSSYLSAAIALRWLSLDPTDDIGSGNGLVPPENKPSTEPTLTYFHVAIWRH